MNDLTGHDDAHIVLIGAEAIIEEGAPVAEKRSWFRKLRDGLKRSSSTLSRNLSELVTKRKLDDDMLQDLEDILVQADLGIDMASKMTETLARERYQKEISDEEIRHILAKQLQQVLLPVAKPMAIDKRNRPHIVLVVGVNGAGKTTTIGKLAAQMQAKGLSVMLAAGDTFRAAAVEQLKIWGERVGAPVVARKTGDDAASLVYDAMKEAKESNKDVLLIDTAGRLHNKTELMAELEKIVRVIKKHDEQAPHDVLLVLDATTGQNAMNQANIFREKTGVTGFAMTKLDGTARGGILIAIAAKHQLPIHVVGVGEGIDDLQPFDPHIFAEAMVGLEEKTIS